jgi:hypothetical protein
MALQKSGITITSSAGMKGLKNALKGKSIEIRQDELSQQLRRKWGVPERLPNTNVENSIGDRNGVISFFRIPGYDVGGQLGGHIDLVDGKGFKKESFLFFWTRVVDLQSECGSSCYWKAEETWFWELK